MILPNFRPPPLDPAPIRYYLVKGITFQGLRLYFSFKF